MFGGRGSSKGAGKGGKKGQAAWYGTETWKGGSGGGKSGWSDRSGDWGASSWRTNASSEVEEKTAWTRRLVGRESLVKKLLRPYAQAGGQMLYSNGDDLALLQKASIRKLLTADVSEMSRRPAYGVSMMGGTVATFSTALTDEKVAEARQKINELFGTKEGKGFLEACSSLDFETSKFDPESKKKCFAKVFAFLKEHKELLYKQLPRVAVAAAKEYAALHALDALVKADALKAWAQQIPEEEFIQDALDEFRQKSKPSADTAANFLVKAYKARRKQEADWKSSGLAFRGDDSSEEPRRKSGRKNRKESSGSESSEGSSSAPRKAKRKEPEEAKAKRSKKKETDSGSRSESPKRKKAGGKEDSAARRTKKNKNRSRSEASASPLVSKKEVAEETDAEVKAEESSGERASLRKSKKEEGHRAGRTVTSVVLKDKKEKEKTRHRDEAKMSENKHKKLKDAEDAAEKKHKKRKRSSASHGSSKEKKRAVEAATRRAEEARSAAFTAWRQSDAQTTESALEGLVTEVGNEEEGLFPVSQLAAALHTVPEELRPAALPDLSEAAGAMVSSKDARSFLQQLLDATHAVVAFYEEQQAAGARSSA